MRQLVSHTLNNLFVEAADLILREGHDIEVRGSKVRELCNVSLTLTNPYNSIIMLPGRHNNVVAMVAETLWMLAGRDDMEFLSKYLPRAPEFSDDGAVWRGAYGPRLRNWKGDGTIDQLALVVDMLRKDPTTRRAVMSIYDPDRDFVDSLDIPCNNWLHFLARDGKLNLSVAVRSNDLMWGFSGINVFEWSILLTIVAALTGMELGQLTMHVTSLHLYERHWKRARRIVDKALVYQTNRHVSPTLQPIYVPLIMVDDVAALDVELARILADGEPNSTYGSLFEAMGWVLRVHDARTVNDFNIAMNKLSQCSCTAFTGPVILWARKKHGDGAGWRDSWLYWHQKVERGVFADTEHVRMFVTNLTKLQQDKGAEYGESWRRWGELGSILPNIGRKADRYAEQCARGYTVFECRDSLTDLIAYCTLYYQYLLTTQTGTHYSFGSVLTHLLSPLVSVSTDEVAEVDLNAAYRQLVQKLTERPEYATTPTTTAHKKDCVACLVTSAANILLSDAEFRKKGLQA